jgi:arylsulfatase A-like enzyme
MRPKNVLFVLSDALRAERLGAYGNVRKVSRALDALAEDGVLFENAFTVSPITNVSTTSFLTGCVPKIHGVRHHTGVFRGTCPTMAEALRGHGYRTGAIVSCATLDRTRGLAGGFDHYDDRFGPEAPKGVKPPDPNERSISRHTGTAVGRAIEWLEDIDHSVPFFLFLHLFDTHSPYNPTREYLRRFSMDYSGGLNGSEREGIDINLGKIVPSEEDVEYLRYLYDGEVFNTDQNLATLFEYMGAAGVFESTAIVVTSDHGVHLGERGIWGSGRRLYDTELRIPLILYGFPELHPRRVASLVSSIDVFPTVMELLGLEYDRAVDGTSRASESRDGACGNVPPVYAETFMPMWPENRRVCVRTERWKLIHPVIDDVDITESFRSRVINKLTRAHTFIYRLLAGRIGRWQQVRRALDAVLLRKEERTVARIERRDKTMLGETAALYDLVADPMEQTNVIGVKSAVVEYLVNELVFQSDRFLLTRDGGGELTGVELEKANEVLTRLGYRG